MKRESLELFACPRDRASPLLLTTLDPGTDVESGALTCPRCATAWPIRDGVANFLLLERGDTARTKESEIRAREQELQWPSRRLERYERRLEAESVLARLRPNPRDILLDAGCGLGVITTRIAATGARVFATDFAQARLGVLLGHLRRTDQVEPAVADVNHLPFRPATFTRIVSTQVLEHLPTRELRRAFVCRLYDLLSPGGSLVLTVYNHDRTRRRTGKPREGHHRSGIFYHCYDPDELRDDVQPFRIAELCGIRHQFRGSYKLQFFARLGALGARIDHALEASRLSLAYGSLLLVHGVKE